MKVMVFVYILAYIEYVLLYYTFSWPLFTLLHVCVDIPPSNGDDEIKMLG